MAIFALILIIGGFMVMSSGADDSSATSESQYGDVYTLTYYGEVEGTVVIDRTVAVSAGTVLSIYSPVSVEDYNFIGWVCNGVTYEVGDKFIMPEGDASFIATWESSVTVSANVDAMVSDPSIIFVVLAALFGISAIVGAVLVQRMRVNALKTV